MGEPVVTFDDAGSLRENDDDALWLAACDERLAAGASLAEVGVPEGLRPGLEVEAAWCQLVRRIWPHSTEPGLSPKDLWSADRAGRLDEHPTELGRFVIRRELGRGSFGVVYLAYDPRLRRELALKVPRGEMLLSSELRARFRNEAMAAAGLDHPNIVAVYEAGEEGPSCFIASAYCPGVTLAAWLRGRSTVVPHRMAAKLVATLADAVEHAHRRGVLHRDLKPSNVLLDMPPGRAEDSQRDDDSNDLVPRVTDFGLAKLLDDEQGAGSPINPTQSGMLVGTPSYMAPEQADAKRGAVGLAADIYSLGVILYEALTGRPPFQGDSVLDTLVLVRTQEVLPPSRLRPRLSRDLETICLHCLNRQPQARYATAGELAEDLRRFLAGEPIRARPAHPVERAVKWIRRHPAIAALGGATATATLAIALVVLVAAVRLKHQRDLAENRRLEAVANLQKARQAVDRMLTRVSAERLKDIPQVEPVQRALLEDALEFYRDFARDAGGDPEILFEASRAYGRLGGAYHSFGRMREADSCYREARGRSRRSWLPLPLRSPRMGMSSSIPASGWQGSLASGNSQPMRLSHCEKRPPCSIRSLSPIPTTAAANRSARAWRMCAAGSSMIWGSARPPKPNIAKASNCSTSWRNDSRRYRTTACVPVCAATISRFCWKSPGGLLKPRQCTGRASPSGNRWAPQIPRTRITGRSWHSPRSTWRCCWRRPDVWSEAERSLQRAAGLRASLTKDFPNTPWHFLKLAEANRAIAKLRGDRGDIAEARRLREGVVAASRAALALAPENVEFRHCLARECASLVETLIALKKHDEATRCIAEMASLSQDSAKDILRAGSLIARCVPLAAADLELPGSRRAELADAYAKRAIELVDEAARKGYRDADAIRKDQGFDSLRARNDFRALLAGLEKPPGVATP